MYLFKILLVIFCSSTCHFLSGNIPLWSFESSKEGWNTSTLAEMYFHHSETQRQWAWELLGKYRFNGNENVLDFGCGDGKITSELSHMVPEGSATGIDISSEMIQLAQKRFSPAACPNLTFRQTDAMTFADSSDSSYDLICAFTVFHLIADPLETLKNLKQCLKPDGKILIVIPNGANAELGQATHETFVKYQFDLPWGNQKPGNALSMSTLEGCSHYLTEAGYRILSLEIIETESGFYSAEELIKWMIGSGAANWKIPFSQSYAFFSDLVHRFYELDPSLIDENGGVHFKMPKIHIIAEPLNG